MRSVLPLLLAVGIAGCDCRGARLMTVFDAGCSEEICDGRDNDCNGRVDELPSRRCGVGQCERVVLACYEGADQPCVPGTPSAEACDGLDNDCNGIADDGLPPRECGVGACRNTVPACAVCEPALPSAESCDGLDNDCDGEVDEALGETTCGAGECRRVVPACDGGACVPGTPVAETCNGLDDDCNGTVDDGACQPPTVTCPQAVTVRVGDTVSLSAQALAGDRPISTLQWSVVSQPAGSAASIGMASTATASFTPARDGAYELSFCATDDGGQTSCCTTTVSTTSCASPPAPPATTACGTSWDGRPIVQFSNVPAGLRYELSSAGSSMVLASASSGQNWLRPAARIAPGGPIPGAPIALELRSCRVSDPTCCSSPTPLAVNVVATCTTPTAPTASNIVLSEYVINGVGACPSVDCVTQDTCQAGESIEITNLSNCPVTLDGFHFAYRNASASAGSVRWMNFGSADVIPPRGVYVAIRSQQFASTCAAPLGAEATGLYGLKISSLQMQGTNLCSGWFNNAGGGLSELQLAPGVVPNSAALMFTPAATIARVAPYLSTSSSAGCPSIGFDAVDSCGSVVGGSVPTAQLTPNQLGRLWHPCDAVLGPVPACVRD